ncbi:hypothetical protein [Larkinella humicola]|uniref:Uncharacterized protein n=1 Tax=Larkinella humicola TaxID=2607654 RepID=A0A5N1JCI7_9BACT|nr:hypothetical protein [Larkinella humicola]KAA9349463.1 hypothetical protein F0P93_24085 [Larkinella humicola]
MHLITILRRFRPFILPFAGITAFLFLDACQSSTPEPTASGFDYQPLEKGNYWIYEVTEQQFALNGSSTTQTYQLRELITHSYVDTAVVDPTASATFRVERHRRTNDSQPWQPDSVSSIRIADNQLIKTENNRSYVKLVFPLIDQFQWNGNVFNTAGEDLYQLKNTAKPFNVLSKPFPETATIVQQNDSTLVSQDKRLEIYARGVGLIYKEKVQLQFCSSTPSCVGKAQIDYGMRQYIRLRSYGK